MRLIDLFGNEIDVKDLEKVPKTIKRAFRNVYGFNHDHTCKDCKFLVSKMRDRTYYKCSLMGISASEATDIRLKDVACRKWEKEE